MGKLDEFVTIKEAARYLGVSPNTLRNWGTVGKIKMHRNPLSNYRLFKKSDLQSFFVRLSSRANIRPAGNGSQVEVTSHGRRKRFIELTEKQVAGSYNGLEHTAQLDS